MKPIFMPAITLMGLVLEACTCNHAPIEHTYEDGAWRIRLAQQADLGLSIC